MLQNILKEKDDPSQSGFSWIFLHQHIRKLIIYAVYAIGLITFFYG